MSWTAWGVGSMPLEVRTNRGSLKCLRKRAKLMLTVDWLSSRFSAVRETLRVRCSSVMIVSNLRSMLVMLGNLRGPGLPSKTTSTGSLRLDLAPVRQLDDGAQHGRSAALGRSTGTTDHVARLHGVARPAVRLQVIQGHHFNRPLYWVAFFVFNFEINIG